MEVLLIFVYIVITTLTILYTYQKTMEKKNYVKEVHLHMASLMFFHMTVVATLLVLEPAFLDNIYISIFNTLLSIMFSILFYLTDKEKKHLLYFYNFFYLIFASILMTEIFTFFKNDTFVQSFILIFIMFLCDMFLYTKDRRKMLMIGYGVLSVIAVITGGFMDYKYIASVLISISYALLVLGYMYYDHDYLENNKEKHHLIDSLKYYLDFEGMIVRAFDARYLEK